MHLMGTPEKILLFRISRSYRVINLHNNFFPPSILYFFWFLGSEMCLALYYTTHIRLVRLFVIFQIDLWL